ncbi:hypothetical protein LLEC1_06353 [Akanthomyces lecanii]|uniref:Aminoglycoside phosphotransferase domain-containing protein n=1 Tax=Cordyceps confragosa TaxID=2714763 RepID=A0A179I486_CORDF|nr:hypothetical protein LLEC1_06353 [Akanthomyces lecanii]
MLPIATKQTLATLAEAIASEDDELPRMRYPELVRQFYAAINDQKTELEHMICKLLQVPTCRIIESNLWRSGSFNVAILVRLPHGKNVYLRLPFLHRIGEYTFPGNVDEKIRTEAATYLWLQRHCPDVPIPTLHAFGLPNGSTYTRPQNTAWWRRIWTQLNRVVSLLLGRAAAISYTRHPIRHGLPSGFLLISEAEGKKLLLSWNEHHHDQTRQENLFRGLSRIALSMNAIPQPRLGAWRLQDDDTIALDNRPLNLYMHMLESESIPSGIPRGRTYTEVDGYLSDLLSLQDAKLRGQPNAISDGEDGKRQLAASMGMRAVMHHFIDPGTRQGPFYMTLNDLTLHNIFVDEQWNITCIIDLEWTHTLPAEMQSPPYWLTSKSVDGFHDQEDVEEFDEAVNKYLTIYEEEEVQRNGSSIQATAQRKAWGSGGFWFFRAATVPRAMYNLFNGHIQPLFNEEHPDEAIFDEVFFSYWGRRASDFVDKKVGERAKYVQELSNAYRDIGVVE